MLHPETIAYKNSLEMSAMKAREVNFKGAAISPTPTYLDRFPSQNVLAAHQKFQITCGAKKKLFPHIF